MRPRVFVASSKEGLAVAEALQRRAEHDAELTLWTDDVFALSQPALASLLELLGRVDAGIFVLTADDVAKIRKKEVPVARDNVIFELGLFVGRLGPQRCFVVKPRSADDLHLPSDLTGFTPAMYEEGRSDRNLAAAIGPVWTRIRDALAAQIFIEYPLNGYYGDNVLAGSGGVFRSGQTYSLAVKAPVGKPLRVVMQRTEGLGIWLYGVGTQDGWRISDLDSSSGTQVFECHAGGAADLKFLFSESGRGRVECFEDRGKPPSRTAEIRWSPG